MLLSERLQSEKPTYYIVPTWRCGGEGKVMETVKITVVPGGKVVGRREENSWGSGDTNPKDVALWLLKTQQN